ncbi:MAG: nitroreductase family protein [Thermomicrobiales bacterium]
MNHPFPFREGAGGRKLLLSLSADEVLTTTRSVRKRMDFTRPVERDVIEECLRIAQQAPTGSNAQGWQFVVVTDAAKRLAIADLYRKGWERYRSGRATTTYDDPNRATTQARVSDSAQYLADHFHEAPIFVIPCILGRTDGLPANAQSGVFGSILPAAWSFMLAARARGLGTCWTTIHLMHEKETADVLGIPYERVMQVALIPVAYTKGTDFKPAPRESLASMVHWETW